MHTVPDLARNLFRPPDGDLPRDAEDRADYAQYWHNWGFTIYRTCYTPQSEQGWQALLAKIRAEADEESHGHVEFYPDERAEIEVAGARLRELFRLDVRSDASLLDGADFDRLRELYKREADGDGDGEDGLGRGSSEQQQPPKPVMHEHVKTQRLFLVADAEVLDDAGRAAKFWVKCVQADYDPAKYVGHVRYPQCWWGWFGITTGSILQLWADLYYRDVTEIAPGSWNKERSGAPLWDGY